MIHPPARAALGNAGEADSLHLEFLANEVVEIDATRDDVAAEHARGFSADVQSLAERVGNLAGEKRHLAAVVRPMVEEAVAAKAVAGDALDLGNGDRGVFAGRLRAPAEEVVSRGNVDRLHPHGGTLYRNHGLSPRLCGPAPAGCRGGREGLFLSAHERGETIGKGNSGPVRVLFFAQAREAAGVDSVDLPLSAPVSGREVWARLLERFPGLADVRAGSRLSRNEEYVDEETRFHDDDVAAVIPPVSGG